MNARTTALAVFGASAFLLVGESHSVLVLARLALCGATLAAVSAIDITERRIPNRLVIPAAVACAGLSVAAGEPASNLLTGAALVALLALVSIAWPRGLGMGDVKLALLVVAGLDGDGALAIVIGVALATLAGIAAITRYGVSARSRSLPLAPFIAAGSLLALAI